MTQVFADAHYFVALINDKDQSHPAALAISQTMHGITVVTSEEALDEVLAYFAERGRYLRQVAAAYVDDILGDPDMLVCWQSHQSFLDGFALYKARPDKGYSRRRRLHGLVFLRCHLDMKVDHPGQAEKARAGRRPL